MVDIETGASLDSLTTFRMGGGVERLWRPVRGDDLRGLPRDGQGRYRVLSGGSNILANDGRRFADVVYMGSYDRGIEALGGGRYRVGASARIQELIRRANADGYGGLEELVSVPGMVGGLIAMNASVPSVGTCVSDHLVSVEAFDGSRVVFYSEGECGFGYRTSRFRDGLSIVLSAEFHLPEQDPGVSAARIRARVERVRRTQDRALPNFGSVFRRCDPRIMAAVRRLGVRSGGARFSKIASNWLLNDGATFDDALACIRRVESAHRMLGRPCSREVVVWE